MARIVLVRPGQGQNSGRQAAWIATTYTDVVEIQWGTDVHRGKKGQKTDHPQAAWKGRSPESYLRDLVESKLNEGKGYVYDTQDWAPATAPRNPANAPTPATDSEHEAFLALNGSEAAEALDVADRIAAVTSLAVKREAQGPHAAIVSLLDTVVLRIPRAGRNGGGSGVHTEPAIAALYAAIAVRCGVAICDRNATNVDPRDLVESTKGAFAPELIAVLESLSVLYRPIDWKSALGSSTLFA